jgi:biopolymer transport protein ExbB
MFELFEKGGVMMYPILVTSILAIAVIIERAYFLYFKIKKLEDSVIENMLNSTDNGNAVKAIEFLEQEESIYKNYYISILQQNEEELMEKAAILKGDELLFNLNRRLNMLSIAASVLPLMGLLGTVLGMIKVFSRVAQAGDAADISVLAGGIWEALLTTAAGMAIAIPVMLFYHFFKRSIEKIAHSMSQNGDKIIASFRKKKTK